MYREKVESIPAAVAPTVFIIRVWVERGVGGDSRRGYVQHIASGSRRYFRDFAEAADFIAALSGPEAAIIGQEIETSADPRSD